MLGTTRIVLHGPNNGADSRQAAPLAIFLAGTLSAVMAYAIFAPSPRPMRAPPGTAGAAPATFLQAAGALRDKLATMGLAGAIRTDAADNAVVATGAILASETQKWTEAQSWFDGRYGGTVPLVTRIGRADTDMPLLDVAAVAMLPVPVVIARDGQHYTEGAVIDGGWTIARIAMDAITLRQSNGHTVRITL